MKAAPQQPSWNKLLKEREKKRGAGQAMNKTSVGLGSSAGRGPCRKEEALQAFHAWLQGAVRKVEAGFKFSFAF